MLPQRVDPLVHDMGTAGGHRLVLLSIEAYLDWADLRFARIETPGAPPLPRRVPRPGDWDLRVADEAAEVLDAVGRGDRAFSNGEVRFRPVPAPGSQLQVSVHLAPGAAPLSAVVTLPPAIDLGDPA